MFKNKKLILVILLTIMLSFSISAKTDMGNSTIGLAGASIALCEDLSAVLLNPASLYFLENKGFYVAQSIKEDYSNFISGPVSYFQRPSSDTDILFSGNNMALAFNVYSQMFRLDNTAKYNLESSVDLQLSFNVGFAKHYSISMFVSGGNKRYFENVPLSSGKALYGASTHLVNYNDTYQTKSTDFFNGGLSFLMDFDFVSFTIMSDEILSLAQDSSDNYSITLENGFNGLTVGLSFKTDTFLSTDDIAPIRALFNFDFHNIGSDIARELRFSTQLNVQLSEKYIIKVQAGYAELKPSWKDFFKYNGENAIVTAGLGGKIDVFDVYSYVTIPLKNMKRPLNVGIGFSYSPN